jgi:hypothetical protein
MRGHETCHYCGLTHTRVEAGGMWHCPNVLCTGPGAASWRMQVPSFREEPGGRSHTVDDGEMSSFGLAYASAITDDDSLAAHIRASASRWRPTPDQPGGAP